MNTRHLLLLAGIAIASIPVIAGVPEEPEAVIVRVDCDAGDDLAAALGRAIRVADASPDDEGTDTLPGHARPVVLEISGECETNVVIDRDRVTLRGAGERMAVLVSAVDPEAADAVPIVDVRYAQDVVIENLELKNGWAGVRLLYSGASIRHGLIRSSTFGLSSVTSDVLVTDTVFRENLYAAASESADSMELRDFLIEDSAYGVLAVSASAVVIGGGTIRNCNFGVLAVGGANVSVVDGLEIAYADSVIGNALLVSQDGYIWVSDTRVLGQNATITLDRGGSLRTHLDGLTTEGVIQARGGGKLFALGGQFTDIWLSDLAVASIRAASITGTLSCAASAEAFCFVSTIGQVQGCANCLSSGPSGTGNKRESARVPDRQPPEIEDELRKFQKAKGGRQVMGR